ncbi:hypothetical protein TNCV_4497151 [Trichonephila clavipes]|nr:hypothetical protein TNCV_4497151 [Trichonephila clavipes]
MSLVTTANSFLIRRRSSTRSRGNGGTKTLSHRVEKEGRTGCDDKALLRWHTKSDMSPYDFFCGALSKKSL